MKIPPRASPPTSQQADAIAVYSRLLDEARTRLTAVGQTLGGATGLPDALVTEFSFLQFRMLCECVALCCLVAHGDIGATASVKLQKEYAADSILKKLELLHSNFFPHPVTMSSALNAHHITKLEAGFLTKTDLISLYHECGDRLHRGSLAKFRSSAPKAHLADPRRAHELVKRFSVLLTLHHVASKSNLSHFICFLSHKQTNGKAMVVLAQSPLPA